jgi:hypothetical protein
MIAQARVERLLKTLLRIAIGDLDERASEANLLAFDDFLL